LSIANPAPALLPPRIVRWLPAEDNSSVIIDRQFCPLKLLFFAPLNHTGSFTSNSNARPGGFLDPALDFPNEFFIRLQFQSGKCTMHRRESVQIIPTVFIMDRRNGRMIHQALREGSGGSMMLVRPIQGNAASALAARRNFLQGNGNFLAIRGLLR
jgi:hypothetical protein